MSSFTREQIEAGHREMSELKAQTVERVRLRGLIVKLKKQIGAVAPDNDHLLKFLKRWLKPKKLKYEYLSEISSVELRAINALLEDFYGVGRETGGLLGRGTLHPSGPASHKS